jgi:hypothetical protein
VLWATQAAAPVAAKRVSRVLPVALVLPASNAVLPVAAVWSAPCKRAAVVEQEPALTVQVVYFGLT